MKLSSMGYILASQVAQWSRICLPIQETQETWLQSLGGKDPLGRGHGNPLQYSCLENPMDRQAWQATVRGVAKSRARLSTHTWIQLQLTFFFYFMHVFIYIWLC